MPCSLSVSCRLPTSVHSPSETLSMWGMGTTATRTPLSSRWRTGSCFIKVRKELRNVGQRLSLFHSEKSAYARTEMSASTTSPDLPAFQFLGQPVEISEVEKALQALFLASGDPNDDSGIGVARASLINLAL